MAQGLAQDYAFVASIGNSTATPLGAGATFTGATENILGYNQIVMQMAGGPAIAMGSLYFEFSPDGVNWDVSVPSLIRDPSFVIPVPLIPVAPWFRVRYINDGGSAAIAGLGLSETAGTPTLQSSFRLNIYYFKEATTNLARTLDQTIQGSDPVVLVRSIATGKQPDGDWENQFSSGSDPGNSSTAPLGGGGVFTGSARGTTGYGGMMVLVYSDQPSVTNGLVAQFSETENFALIHRTVPFTYTVTGQGEPFFIPSMFGEFMRVRYTNGASAQTAFVLRTELLAGASQAPLGPVSGDMSDSSLVQMVRNVAVAENDGGTYGNITRGALGGLRHSVLEHETATPLKMYDSVEGGAVASVGSGAAVQICTAPPADTRSVLIQSDPDNGNVVIYLGPNNAVVGSNAMHGLGSAASVTYPIGSGQTFWAIASTGSNKTVRWTFLRRASF